MQSIANLYVLDAQIRANIYIDILEQSKVLTEAGNHVAGMVLIGSILEGHLRQMCDQRGMVYQGNRGISEYNDLLEREFVSHVRKEIKVVAALQSAAAHCDHERVQLKDVEAAYDIVERFIAYSIH